MSLTCQKAISINVVGVPQPGLLYFDFDTFRFGEPVDRNSGTIEWLTVPTTTFLPGKIVNGVQLTDFTAELICNLNQPAVPAYAGTGLTICFWLRVDAIPVTPALSSTSIVNLNLNGGDGHNYGWVFNFVFSAGNGPIAWAATKDGVGQAGNNVQINPLTIGTFFFIALTYDVVSGLLGMSVNDGAQSFSTVPFAAPANGTWNQLVSQSFAMNQNYVITIDECLVNLYKVLSQPAILQLYNMGAGQTWPLAGSLGS